MIRFGCYYCICFLLLIQAYSIYVAGWSLSPTTAVSKSISRSTEARFQTWQRTDLLFSRSQSKLAQDYTDGDSDDFDNDGEYYDDFADFGFVGGDDTSASNDEPTTLPSAADSDSESPMSVLQQRFQKLALTEQVNRQQISDNFKEGYWGVWGCSLDPYTDENAETKTSVTSLKLMPLDDDGMDGDDDSALLIVGRSDGSIIWLKMDTISSPSSFSSDSDRKNSVENRSVTTYFENKLVAKPTDDGGMVVDKALQRRESDGNIGFGGDDATNEAGGSSPRLPFDILAQIQTTGKATSDADVAIVEMLPIPSSRMLWTISKNTPNAIRALFLFPDSETGYLLPNSSFKVDLETVHTSPIVAMKTIPKTEEDDSEASLVVSVSDDGQVVVWELSSAEKKFPPSIKIKLNTNLFQQEGEYDSVSSVDVDDQYLYLGTQAGKISIFSVSAMIEGVAEISDPLLPLVKSFEAFTSSNPGISTILAAGPGSLGATNGPGGSTRPPTKSLIAGDMSGGLKQWELIPAGPGRLEYWPRMATQKLPGGKPHVYETRDYSWDDYGQRQNSCFPAIRQLLCTQQVLLAATDYDLTVWDSSTGKILYDMQGLDFTSGSRPNLMAANDSVLVTNGMENFVCVHDFTMERITSENVDNYLEQDNFGNNDDDSDDDSSW